VVEPKNLNPTTQPLFLELGLNIMPEWVHWLM